MEIPWRLQQVFFLWVWDGYRDLNRGVYPYLLMATNAPWSILGGMKNRFWGDKTKGAQCEMGRKKRQILDTFLGANLIINKLTIQSHKSGFGVSKTMEGR